MLKLLTSQQMRQADQFTIVHEPVSSLDLMERASSAFVGRFTVFYPNKNLDIDIYCGTGNNGGDGLAIARHLFQQGYINVRVIVVGFSAKKSDDFIANIDRLKTYPVEVTEIKKAKEASPADAELIIDAILGTGLSKPLAGEFKSLVELINDSGKPVVSVDIPTGLKAEGAFIAGESIIRAHTTISFQLPKISFLLPDSGVFANKFVAVDIGLADNFIQSAPSPYLLLTSGDVTERLKPRLPFSHKGNYGHALIIAGTMQTMGAALLCAEACVFAGAGLTTACIPESGLTSLNVRLPEAMAIIRDKRDKADNIAWEKYSALVIGPGLGVSENSKVLLEQALRNYKKPVVFDADAINLLSKNYELMSLVPEGSIFTPHVKEFDRLFGEHQSWSDRLETGIDRAVTLGCTIVLKNRYTIIFTPAGECIFNESGSPSLAIGGSGDVLAGVITSLLAQGYNPPEAAMLGVFIHGRAAEHLEYIDEMSVVPGSQLIRGVPRTLNALSGHIE